MRSFFKKWVYSAAYWHDDAFRRPKLSKVRHFVTAVEIARIAYSIPLKILINNYCAKAQTLALQIDL